MSASVIFNDCEVVSNGIEYIPNPRKGGKGAKCAISVHFMNCNVSLENLVKTFSNVSVNDMANISFEGSTLYIPQAESKVIKGYKGGYLNKMILNSKEVKWTSSNK